MKRKCRILSLTLALLLCFFAIAGCSTPSNPDASSGEQKSVNLTIVYQDETEETIELKTTADILGDAMLEEGLISEDEYKDGFVTTINGVTADYDADGAWWALYDSEGNMTTTGISDTEIADGDSFKFVYTVG